MTVYVVTLEATELDEDRFLYESTRVFTTREKAVAHMQQVAEHAEKYMLFVYDPAQAHIDLNTEIGMATIDWGDPCSDYLEVRIAERELE